MAGSQLRKDPAIVLDWVIMGKLEWDVLDEKKYEHGVDQCVFYPKNGIGYAWSGVVAVKETTIDSSQALIYVDGIGHQNQLLFGNFALTVDAFTYPPEFEPFDGCSSAYDNQSTLPFDFCYRTMQDGGYKIHLVYNARATPTKRDHLSVNSSAETELFSWELTTRPEVIPHARASSHFVVDSTQVNPGLLDGIESRLYGEEGSFPDMPEVANLLGIFEEYSIFRVSPHGDGTVTISGPDDGVTEVSPGLWKLEWPSVTQIATHIFKAQSL